MARLLDDWLNAYLAYTGEHPAPEAFHKWTGVGTLGAALKRNIWLPRGYSVLYPNNYTVLIGPPASMKSSAMDIGKGLARGVPGLKISVDSTSREQLIVDLMEGSHESDGSMACFSYEFGSFFQTSEMGMVLFLIEVYDARDEFEHRSRSGGNLKIERPCFNIVACTTPEWLHSGLPIKTHGIGLMSRVILVYGDSPRYDDPWTDLTPRHDELRQKLQADLIHINQNVKGPVSYTNEAKEFYTAWYKKRRENQIIDPRLQGFYGRKPDHVHKTAMALSAGRRDTRVIDAKDVEDALILIGDVEATMPQAFAASGKNVLAVDYVQVTQAIALATPKGGITRAELMKAFQHTVRFIELIEVLETLEVTGAILKTMDNGIIKYRVPALPEQLDLPFPPPQ